MKAVCLCVLYFHSAYIEAFCTIYAQWEVSHQQCCSQCVFKLNDWMKLINSSVTLQESHCQQMTYLKVGGVSALNSNYIIFQLNLLLAHADSAGHPISACPATTKFPQSLCVLWIIEQIPTKSRGWGSTLQTEWTHHFSVGVKCGLIQWNKYCSGWIWTLAVMQRNCTERRNISTVMVSSVFCFLCR